MSSRLPRLALSSSAAALALVVALPAAALACEKGDGGGSGGGSHQEQSKDHKSSDAKEHGDKSNSETSKGEGKGKSESGQTSGETKGGAKGDDHNPPGNNGTIKIDYPAPADSGHANRPHPGCAFQLRMFDFDTNQYGTITFVGQAPTKLGTLLTQTHMLLSDDAAGGGQDVDAVYSYTAQQLGLIGKPQAKQGWHIKVSVDADNAPGGAKQKVFWLKCAEAPTTSGTVPTSTTATTTQGGGTTDAASAPTAVSAPTGVTAQNAEGAAATTTTLSAGTTAGAASASTNRAATAATAGAAAAAANQGGALPFTGFALGTAILLALAVLLAGALAIRAGRRRTTEV